MQKRKYTRIKAIEAEILQMHSEGETHRAIAEPYGLEREQVKKFLKRHRKRQSLLLEEQTIEPKGRPRSDCYDFLQRAGQPERDAELAKKIGDCQHRSD